MPVRRQSLERLTPKPDTHAGLWLDKYLRYQAGLGDKDQRGSDLGAGARALCIQEAASRTIPVGYAAAFARWEGSFGSTSAIRRFKVETTGRLVIGLGSKNVLELGIRLDHTWGMPLLPGSALKGLASRTAHLHLDGEGWHRPTNPAGDDGGAHHAYLFGTTARAGAILFHDAWWVPSGKQTTVPLDLDVMTVHHPKYYQDPENPEPPSDFDSPVPNAFVTTHGTFQIVLEKAFPDVDDGWLDVAHEILVRGLDLEGLGAKTNAGYGRLRAIDGVTTGVRRATSDASSGPIDLPDPAADAALLQAGNAGNKIPELLLKYRTAGDAPLKSFAEAAIKVLGEKWLRGKKDKQYVKDLYAAAGRPAPT